MATKTQIIGEGEGSLGNVKIITGRQVLHAATSLGNMRRPGTGLRNVD